MGIFLANWTKKRMMTRFVLANISLSSEGMRVAQGAYIAGFMMTVLLYPKTKTRLNDRDKNRDVVELVEEKVLRKVRMAI